MTESAMVRSPLDALARVCANPVPHLPASDDDPRQRANKNDLPDSDATAVVATSHNSHKLPSRSADRLPTDQPATSAAKREIRFVLEKELAGTPEGAKVR